MVNITVFMVGSCGSHMSRASEHGPNTCKQVEVFTFAEVKIHFKRAFRIVNYRLYADRLKL